MIPWRSAKLPLSCSRFSGAPPVETHISAVFVGRDTAWKLKRAVAFPFVDLTRPETRKRLALRELELNRPMTPEIYHDVAAIVRCEEDRRLAFAVARRARTVRRAGVRRGVGDDRSWL